MDSEPSRYAKSARPVNARTAVRALPTAAEAVHPLVQQRIKAQQAKNRLGAALAEQLRQPYRPASTVSNQRSQLPFSAWTVASSVLAAASCIALVFAGIGHSGAWAGVGAAGLLVAVGVLWAGRRWAPQAIGNGAETAFAASAPIWSEASITALDRAIDIVAPVLPGDAAGELSAIKLQLVRIHQQASSLAVADEHFTVEDRLYLGELVRRYLPDSLQSYLAVPQAQRDLPIAGLATPPATATSLLCGQLQMLRLELGKKEAKLTQSRAENLLRQQRFLESKASR